MNMLLECLLALFATVGLSALIWLLFGRFLSTGPPLQPLTMVVHISGDAAALEQTLWHLSWLKRSQISRFSVILVDGGLNAQGREAVRILLAREPDLLLCTPEALPTLIQKDG